MRHNYQEFREIYFVPDISSIVSTYVWMLLVENFCLRFCILYKFIIYIFSISMKLITKWNFLINNYVFLIDFFMIVLINLTVVEHSGNYRAAILRKITASQFYGSLISSNAVFLLWEGWPKLLKIRCS